VEPGLYLVATPIGNLRDMTLRALDVLAAADLVLAEDTRVTAKLLAIYGISKPLTAYNDHNAARERPRLLGRLRDGARIALVSDAGTPLVSDPGFKLVREAIQERLPVHAVPGASAALTGLVLSGLPSDRFLFAGFLPPKTGERQSALEELKNIRATLIFFESGPRLAETLKHMSEILGMRSAAVARELTKQFEQIAQMPAAQFPQWLADDPQRMRGEFVLVLHGAPRIADPAEAEGLRVLDLLLAELPLKSAVQLAARISGASRNKLYEAALQRQSERS